jgi:hypothetical protein
MTSLCGEMNDSPHSLVLFTEGLRVGLAVGIEAIFVALLPGCLELGSGDVPIGAAFFCDSAQILAEIFEGGTAEEPIAVVDFVDDETGFKNDDVGNHRIVDGIGVLGDIEVFLYNAACVGEERPVSADSGAVLVGEGDVVGADGDEPAVGDLEFTMELDETFGLAAILRTEASPAEDENHGMRTLQIGELAALCCVVGEFVVGKDCAGDNVSSHGIGSSVF